ncbi:MAG: Amuc_1102 family pilus-like protein [Akkermansiaceae bacterium]|nr:Amuc_1102 family pilus-like protein [Akkermansiaceae bacterium]
MKTLITSTAIAAILCTAASGEILHNVSIDDIELEVQPTPQYDVAGVKDKRFDLRQWIEIEIKLDVQTLERANPSGFIPELKIQWYAIMIDKFEKNKGKEPKVLTGETTLININARDGVAYAAAYISPDTIERLTGKDRANENDLKAIAVIVSGDDLKPNPGMLRVTAEEQSKWWSSGKYDTLEGKITPKSKSPFALLWMDRYPTEKLEE